MRNGLSTFLVLFALISTVQAQPDRAATPSSLNVAAVMYLGDKTLQEELKLTPEQMAKLQDAIRKFNSATFAARGAAAEREKAIKNLDDAFASALQPDQHKRLKQIMLQNLDRRRTTTPISRSLLRYPEVVEQLKLTEEQKARMGKNELMSVVFTDAQKQQWKELLGEPYKNELRLTPTESPSGFFGDRPPSAPATLRHLEERAVAEELKLTADQASRIADVEKQRQAVLTNYREATADEQQKKRTEAQALVEQTLPKILSPDQRNRLQQLLLQDAQSTRGLASIFSDKSVIAALGLTAELEAKLATIGKEQQLAALQLFAEGGEFDALRKRLDEHKRASYELQLQALSAEQRTKLKALIGPPFAGTLRSDSPFAFNTPAQFATRGRTGTALTYEFLYLRDPNLQAELKLTAEQAAKYTTQATAFSDEVRKGNDSLGAWTEKTLAELLQPPQLKQFREICLQQREHRGGLAAIIDYPGVLDAIGLSKPQAEEIRAGKPVRAVLSTEQEGKLKACLGVGYAGTLNPFGTSGTGPRTFGRATFAVTILHCLEQKPVQAELRLSDEQTHALAIIGKEHREALAQVGNLRVSERLNKTRELSQAADQKLEKLLQPSQLQRLRQIMVQQDFDDLPGALALPWVRGVLTLTPEQTQQMQTLQADAERSRALLRTESLVLGRLEVVNEVTVKFDQSIGQRFAKLLTDDQRGKWQELVGAPYLVRIPPLPREPFGGAPPPR